MSPRGSMVDLSDISWFDISESENKVNLDSICISDISDKMVLRRVSLKSIILYLLLSACAVAETPVGDVLFPETQTNEH